MSTEAPRNTGTGEPIYPRRREGGFSGLLSRLFAVPPASIQPPPKLLDFAVRFRQGVADVTNELDIARTQVELGRFEREKQEAREVAEKKEAKRQLTESRLRALGEIREIAVGLGIRDRLAYINATVWEGKGQIRGITTPPESAIERFLRDSRDNDLRGLKAGYELVYFWETAITERGPGGGGDSYSWRYTTGRGSTSLEVIIGYADPGGTSIIGLWPHVGKSGKYANVFSEYLKSRHIKKESYPWYGPEYEAEWLPLVGLNPSDRDGIEKELEQLLISESTARVRADAIPSKLFLLGRESLKEAKSTPQWNKWEYVYNTMSLG